MSDEPPFTFGPPPPVVGIDDDGDAIDDAVTHLPADTTPMPVMPQPLTRNENEDREDLFMEIEDAMDPARIAQALASGEYDRYSRLGIDSKAHTVSDLFVRSLPESTEHGNQFHIAAFDVFVRDGRVFRNALGMLRVLSRTWSYSRALFLIILSHVPDVTWRQMAMVVLTERQPRRPFRIEAFYLPMLVSTIRRYGRHALTLELIVQIDEMFAEVFEPPLGSYSSYRPESIEMPTDARGFAALAVMGDDVYREGIHKRLDLARRRFCRDEIVAFVLGMANTTLDPEELIQIARFALPCFDETIMRIDVTRIVDRVRRRIWARAASEEARSNRRA